MNMDMKELWAKINNYVDPILAGIIILVVLNVAGGGMAYYVFSMEKVTHPLRPVPAHPPEPEPYVPYFVPSTPSGALPKTYEPLLEVNIFEGTVQEVEFPDIGDAATAAEPDAVEEPGEPVDPDAPVVPTAPVEAVYYHGSAYTADGRGAAQISYDDEANPLYLVKVGEMIPGTDIILVKINPYYIVVSQPGYRDTQVPIAGAIQLSVE